jgi:hypothetical protein
VVQLSSRRYVDELTRSRETDDSIEFRKISSQKTRLTVSHSRWVTMMLSSSTLDVTKPRHFAYCSASSCTILQSSNIKCTEVRPPYRVEISSIVSKTRAMLPSQPIPFPRQHLPLHTALVLIHPSVRLLLPHSNPPPISLHHIQPRTHHSTPRFPPCKVLLTAPISTRSPRPQATHTHAWHTSLIPPLR